MSLSLDFKSAFPLSSSSGSAQYGTRTFGLYSTTKSIHDGRHDLTVEVWAAPTDLGARKPDGSETQEEEGVARWRTEGARLVGVSTQVRCASSSPASYYRTVCRRLPSGRRLARVAAR